MPISASNCDTTVTWECPHVGCLVASGRLVSVYLLWDLIDGAAQTEKASHGQGTVIKTVGLGISSIQRRVPQSIRSMVRTPGIGSECVGVIYWHAPR